nr:hypothetical protein BaRGS_018954 [Batillaria attramentaria]
MPHYHCVAIGCQNGSRKSDKLEKFPERVLPNGGPSASPALESTRLFVTGNRDIGYGSAGAVPITSTLSVAGQCDDAGIQTCLNAYQAALEGDATIVTDSARFCP